MPDPLATVLRLRRITVDEAKMALAAQLRVEDLASRAAAAAAAAIDAECDIAADLMAGDGAVEAFAAWLPVGRARAESARIAYDRASSDVARARAALTAARAAAEAADCLLRDRLAALAATAGRRSQSEADDIAARIRAPADR